MPTNQRPETAFSSQQKRLVDRFVDAWRSGEIDALVELLSDTAHITMPPHSLEWSGATDVADLLFDIAPDRNPDLIRFIPARANGEYGFATYVPADDAGHFERHCIMLFGDATQTVGKITGFTEDRVFDLLGLPSTVSAGVDEVVQPRGRRPVAEKAVWTDELASFEEGR